MGLVLTEVIDLHLLFASLSCSCDLALILVLTDMLLSHTKHARRENLLYLDGSSAQANGMKQRQERRVEMKEYITLTVRIMIQYQGGIHNKMSCNILITQANHNHKWLLDRKEDILTRRSHGSLET